MAKTILNYQDKWKEQKVSIDSLLLDLDNIRLETEHTSELEVIADLFVNEEAMDILESIYENGFFPG